MNKHAEFKDLEGQIIEQIDGLEDNSESVHFHTTTDIDSHTYHMFHAQD